MALGRTYPRSLSAGEAPLVGGCVLGKDKNGAGRGGAGQGRPGWCGVPGPAARGGGATARGGRAHGGGATARGGRAHGGGAALCLCCVSLGVFGVTVRIAKL
ncbi:hypothetical protein MPUL_12230 [Mycolicibacterium pulveris]|uniref:Uncharacterized protein n=1 Tax=Mycolicibacterium pulveris TaxID=36813 RepID=A0A7I7UFP0_MYCPV|nr:hypothetical protein MPUL_12230 [Mycolicibacterium pulveris]